MSSSSIKRKPPKCGDIDYYMGFTSFRKKKEKKEKKKKKTFLRK